MKQYDTVNHTYLTNATSELTENLEISLFLSISTELCQKHNMLESQNGPLNKISMASHMCKTVE